MADEMVLKTQKWVNAMYGGTTGYYAENIPENGKTGWTTIYALTRALQIELGITNTADSFGPTTISKFNARFPNGIKQQEDNDESESNIYSIIQGALWCKGYSTGASGITKHFYGGTGGAIKRLKADAGCSDTSSTVTLNVMKALLSMDQFVKVSSGTNTIRTIQQNLNRDYEAYIGLAPCDGLYGRQMNKAMIKVLQAIEGYSVEDATGNFGSGTKANLPIIPTNGIMNQVKEAKATYLVKFALCCNGYDVDISSSVWDNELTSIIKQFQNDICINQTGKCDVDTWMSLLLSKGNPDRECTACDCATIITKEKAETLRNNGYTRVGRYLSGNIASGASKALTKEEIEIIFDAGLYVFLIYQESANSVNYFTIEKAERDVNKAVEHAVNLGIPSGETIYFAVDCDPQDSEITNYIIPYFKKIADIMRDNYNNKYIIGIYGTRNVCSRVSENGYAKSSFVSDMSTGFSGNMGYKIPTNWAFDQFNTITIGTGNGQIEIDKDAMSGRNLGLNNKLMLSDVGQVYYSLVDMFNLAMQYTNNDIKRSNELVLQYIRKNKYPNELVFRGTIKDYAKMAFDIIRWNVVGGTIDNTYCNLVEEKLIGLSFNFNDKVTGKNHDMAHLVAALNASLHKAFSDDEKGFEQVIDLYAGWGGDMISFAKDIQDSGEEEYLTWAKNVIGTDNDKNNNFGTQDYIDDIDAYNLFILIQYHNLDLPTAFLEYYILHSSGQKCEYEMRTNIFMNNIGEEALNAMCNNMNSGEFPISAIKSIVAGVDTEQRYIDAAIEAFKTKVAKEVTEGR